MDNLQQALNTINFDENGRVGGEYGQHDGFFNALVIIDGVDYHVQGCAENDSFDAFDCGHDDGSCGDANERLALKLAGVGDDICYGYVGVKTVLIVAYNEWSK